MAGVAAAARINPGDVSFLQSYVGFSRKPLTTLKALIIILDSGIDPAGFAGHTFLAGFAFGNKRLIANMNFKKEYPGEARA